MIQRISKYYRVTEMKMILVIDVLGFVSGAVVRRQVVCCWRRRRLRRRWYDATSSGGAWPRRAQRRTRPRRTPATTTTTSRPIRLRRSTGALLTMIPGIRVIRLDIHRTGTRRTGSRADNPETEMAAAILKVS